jgi:hypothetical protein
MPTTPTLMVSFGLFFAHPEVTIGAPAASPAPADVFKKSLRFMLISFKNNGCLNLQITH